MRFAESELLPVGGGGGGQFRDAIPLHKVKIFPKWAWALCNYTNTCSNRFNKHQNVSYETKGDLLYQEVPIGLRNCGQMFTSS